MEDGTRIPNPAEFREWVIQTMAALQISPHYWSTAAGIGPNAISKFISNEQRDLRMGTASAVYSAAFRLAAEKDTVLPPLKARQVFDGEPVGDAHV
ncbi:MULTISPECIES: hypothetical protein [Stappiaceae]|uniref:HTH cro/C1-type domain-containing protein n=1 Tax=Pseudovibrio exalbescens TaxID=197461 RepID=A0A1U7JJY0_9HYPH|nr:MULTISPECIES: hypothetical protein [Pseudovibrio]MDX5595634.1 hypothetical protein [Pseudovibrio sp. SPO723]OKL45029.1 hypothetical protein A3843_05440 [Pseudovibrio exalbescens]